MGEALNTAKKPRLDASLDASEERADDSSEQRDRNVLLGLAGPTNGAAGSEVKTRSSTDSDEIATTSEATLGIHGPAELQVAEGGEEGADAALRAAHRAKQAGNDADAVIEALEQAEADYEADHAKMPSLTVRVENALAGNGAGSLPTSPRLGRALSGQRNGLTLDDATRDKVRARLLTALMTNPHVSTKNQSELEEVARNCEQSCYAHSTSRIVYFSKMGNAKRLAATSTESDLGDLPRIASGEARTVVAGKAPAVSSTGTSAG